MKEECWSYQCERTANHRVKHIVQDYVPNSTAEAFGIYPLCREHYAYHVARQMIADTGYLRRINNGR